LGLGIRVLNHEQHHIGHSERLLMQIKTDDEIVQQYISEGRDLPPGEYFVTKTIVVGKPTDLG
jgi:hypothetical protein